MNDRTGIKNILIVGVGGQGILLASEILSQAALAAGHDVKKSEVHGMSQRGGAVNSHVRFGPKIFSPTIPAGQTQFLLGLEKLEALRWSDYLAPGGIIVVNDFRLEPATVTTGKMPYPGDILQRLEARKNCRVVVVDGPALAVQAGDLRAMNTVVLGALSCFLGLEERHWRSGMQARIKASLQEINRLAFELGRKAAGNCC